MICIFQYNIQLVQLCCGRISSWMCFALGIFLTEPQLTAFLRAPINADTVATHANSVFALPSCSCAIMHNLGDIFVLWMVKMLVVFCCMLLQRRRRKLYHCRGGQCFFLRRRLFLRRRSGRKKILKFENSQWAATNDGRRKLTSVLIFCSS